MRRFLDLRERIRVPQPTETHLEMCKMFVQEHKTKLSLIQDACVDGQRYGIMVRTVRGTASSTHRDRLGGGSGENQQRSIRQDHHMFGVLCDEIHELESIAKTSFIHAPCSVRVRRRRVWVRAGVPRSG